MAPIYFPAMGGAASLFWDYDLRIEDFKQVWDVTVTLLRGPRCYEYEQICYPALAGPGPAAVEIRTLAAL